MSIQEPFFFGPENNIFGIYHAANGTPRSHAVLIAGPLLNDNMRANFALRQIALDLSASGYDVLRFDYSGMGNSQQSLEHVGVPTWVENIEQSARELKEISGAESFSVIAVRFAARLIAPLSRSLTLDKIIFWDPIFKGADWLSRIRQTQYAMRQKPGGSEINVDREFLGQLTSPSFAKDLAAMPEIELPDQAVSIIATDDSIHADWSDNSAKTIHRVTFQCNWDDMESEVLFPHEVIELICSKFH